MKTSLCDRYTDEEICVLGEVLAACNMLYSPRWWLGTFDNYAEYQKVKKYLDMPLEDMPLYINDERPFKRVLTLWRLKIGR